MLTQQHPSNDSMVNKNYKNSTMAAASTNTTSMFGSFVSTSLVSSSPPNITAQDPRKALQGQIIRGGHSVPNHSTNNSYICDSPNSSNQFPLFAEDNNNDDTNDIGSFDFDDIDNDDNDGVEEDDEYVPTAVPFDCPPKQPQIQEQHYQQQQHHPVGEVTKSSNSSDTVRDDDGKHNNNNKANVVVVQKPFFIMDFLEQIDPEDLELAQYMLANSNSSSSKSSSGSNSTSNRNGNQNTRSSSYHNAANSSSTSTNSAASSNKDRFETLLSYDSSIYPKQSIMVADSPRSTPRSTARKQSKSLFYERSVAIGTKYNAKGICCARKGDWRKALSYWEDSLEIRTQILGEVSMDVANTCNNIGIALGKLNRYTEAITSLQRSLDIRIALYTWEHEIIAATLHNMGNIYQQQYQYYQQQQLQHEQNENDIETHYNNFYYNDSITSAIHCFTESQNNHPEVARSFVAIGHTYAAVVAAATSSSITNDSRYHDDEELKEINAAAKQAYIDALCIFETIGFTIHHPEVQSIKNDLNGFDNAKE